MAALQIALGAPHLVRTDLWLDEAVAVHTSQLDAAGLVTASRHDTTPPLYYLVLAWFERLAGVSEAAVRWPSLLASGLTAGALFLLARRALGTLPGWCAAAVFVLSDVNQRYAREARPYALATLLCVLSFAALLRALRRPGWTPWVLLAIVDALLVFTHYVALFALAAQLAALLLVWRDRAALRRWLVTHLPLAAALAAWIPPLLAVGATRKMDWIRPPGPTDVVKLLAWFTGGHRQPLAFALLLAATSLALWWGRRRGGPVPWKMAATAALWAFLPAALAFAVSHLAVRCFDARYLLYSSAGLALLWASAVRAVPSPAARLLGALAVCVLTGIGHGRNLRIKGPEWRRAAAEVRARPAPRILLLPSWQLPTFAYYYDREAFRDAPRTSTRLAGQGVRPVVPTTDPADIDLAPEVLLVAASESDPRPLTGRLIGLGYQETQRSSLEGITISRLARTRSPAGELRP